LDPDGILPEPLPESSRRRVALVQGQVDHGPSARRRTDRGRVLADGRLGGIVLRAEGGGAFSVATARAAEGQQGERKQQGAVGHQTPPALLTPAVRSSFPPMSPSVCRPGHQRSLPRSSSGSRLLSATVCYAHTAPANRSRRACCASAE